MMTRKTAPMTIQLPSEILPVDGRFGAGPSKVAAAHLDALAATLAGSEWIVSVAVTIAGSGAALVFHGWEAPCFAVDDTVTGRGVLLGNYARDVEIADTPLGTEELITADEAATHIVQGWQDGRFEMHFPRRFTNLRDRIDSVAKAVEHTVDTARVLRAARDVAGVPLH